VLVRFK